VLWTPGVRGRVDRSLHAPPPGTFWEFEMLTFGSLFAGIGGLDLGLERAGMQCKWQVEIDDYATRILERHWPNVRRWRDVTTFPPDTESNDAKQSCEQSTSERTREDCTQERGKLWDELAGRSISKSEWTVDLICGGFPCQDISYAGRGAGLEGKRSGLFFEAIRVVRLIRPKYVLLENVAALLTRGLDVVLGTLAEIGYDAEWHCIPAAAVGAPHIRDRVFIIAYHMADAVGNSDRAFRSATRKAGDRKNNEKYCQRRRAVQSDGAGAVGGNGPASDANSKRLPQRKREDSKRAWSISGSEPSRSEWWAVEPDVGRVAHGVPSRVDRLRGLGNAVVPQIGEYIGKEILRWESNGSKTATGE